MVHPVPERITPGVLSPSSPPRRERGFRPSRVPELPPTFSTPRLATPVIERASRWPATDTDRHQVLDAVDALGLDADTRSMRERRHAVGLLLDWLASFEGDSWQQRWQRSGANDQPRSWQQLVPVSGRNRSYRATQFSGAAMRLILSDTIRPSYQWLFQSYGPNLYTRFEKVRDPAGFAALDDVYAQMTPRFLPTNRRTAYVELSRMLIHNGSLLADITLADCIEASRASIEFAKKNHTHWYALLRQAGILPITTTPTIIAASRRGQLTVTEMVDQYELVCTPVRDLFVDYLYERAPWLDYSSLRQLSTKLIQLFWKDLELHEPGIDSLHLSDEVARRWKQRVGKIDTASRV